jgi:DNA transformation protein
MKTAIRNQAKRTPILQGDLTSARNIGPTLARRLHAIGVHSLRDLERLTPARAYQEICKQNPGKTMPVCYNLYALQGALLGLYWNDVPAATKKQLITEAFARKKEFKSKFTNHFAV